MVPSISVRHLVSCSTFVEKYSKLNCNKYHNSCSKVLVTFACLWYVIWAAQQLSAVAEVDSGFIYFLLFLLLCISYH